MAKDPDKATPQILEAMRTVQALTWGPLLFQAARAMTRRGFFRELRWKAAEGMTVQELAQATSTSPYGVTVLLEAGMAARLIEKRGSRYFATRAGFLLERDPMVRVNMNFVGDVCYQAAAALDASIESGSPEGLSALGDWPTVYEGLQALPEPAKTSWFEFDHFYSDDSFPEVLPLVFAHQPSRIIDVGGNTGKFARAALGYNDEVEITVVDLGVQIEKCRSNLEAAGLASRATFQPTSVLSPDLELPSGDIIWMSQFLCCFSEPEMIHILRAAARALSPKGKGARLLIMDTLWDCQKNDVAALCLQATSLYFTAVANGNSRMYDLTTLGRCIEAAGLRIVKQTHGIGWGHSLLECAL